MKATNSNPYPKDFEEFLDWFPSEKECIDYLEWIRWGERFDCPKCHHDEYWALKSGLRMCKKCRHKASATSGTVFDDGRKSLRVWFHVMWLLMAQKTGISAKNFYDTFGFGSYQTTWGWLQKLRSVMIRPGRDRLSGRVELDGSYVGGQKEGKRGRGAESKTLVLVGVEGEKAKKLGRVRFRVLSSHTSEEIKKFVSDYIEEGSTLVTDGLKSYDFIDALNFKHERFVVSKPKGKKNKEDSNLYHVHLIVSLLKRWLRGTHQGAVTPGHLSCYLDEFAFRFNRRLSTHRGKLFYRLMQQAVTCRPLSIKDFYASTTGVK